MDLLKIRPRKLCVKLYLWALGPIFLIHSSFATSLPLPLYEIRRSLEKDFSVQFQKKQVKEAQKVIVPKDSIQEESKAKQRKEAKKDLSPGEKKIQEVLKRNRALIKEKYEREKRIRKNSKQGNKALSWAERKKAQLNDWESRRMQTIKRWEEDKKRFLKELPKIKEDLLDLGEYVQKERARFGSSKVGFKKNPLKKSRDLPKDLVDEGQGISLVKGSFRYPVRRQGPRPTCAAFAGVRALELMAPRKVNLSEQALYFQSKEKCQKKPCQKPGSWPYTAFYQSQNSSEYTIPLEEDCPYNLIDHPRNQTQIPLKSGCFRGVAKVKSFREVLSNEDVYQSLLFGFPVIGGFKLSKNFFQNEGYVFMESNMQRGSGIHAQGHALLMIGLMELPKDLHSSQGQKCVLVVNSWGEGWGKGGYACLSQKWFEQYRYDMPFLVLEEVALK